MCGVNNKIIDRAEEAARLFEHTSKLKTSLETARSCAFIPLGLQSDLACLLREDVDTSNDTLGLIIKNIKKM